MVFKWLFKSDGSTLLKELPEVKSLNSIYLSRASLISSPTHIHCDVILLRGPHQPCTTNSPCSFPLLSCPKHFWLHPSSLWWHSCPMICSWSALFHQHPALIIAVNTLSMPPAMHSHGSTSKGDLIWHTPQLKRAAPTVSRPLKNLALRENSQIVDLSPNARWLMSAWAQNEKGKGKGKQLVIEQDGKQGTLVQKISLQEHWGRCRDFKEQQGLFKPGRYFKNSISHLNSS